MRLSVVSTGGQSVPEACVKAWSRENLRIAHTFPFMYQLCKRSGARWNECVSERVGLSAGLQQAPGQCLWKRSSLPVQKRQQPRAPRRGRPEPSPQPCMELLSATPPLLPTHTRFLLSLLLAGKAEPKWWLSVEPGRL